MSFVRAVATVGGMTALSRLFGFARDMMVAAFLGAGPIADAFFVAFKFPNFFRRLFAEGAFNAAFVPLFAGLLASSGRQAALLFAQQALAVLLAALLAVTFAAELAMPWLMVVLAPGFDDPLRHDLAVTFTRITFPYLLFVSLAALFSGVLNSMDRYAAAAGAPILLNVTLMLAMVGLTPLVPTTGHALAWGVAAAGIGQFLWLALALRRAGAELALAPPQLTAGVRRMLKLMLPGALGAGVTQVNLLVDTMLATLVDAVSFLYYADRVNQLPLGVVGAAIGTALLPRLSRQLRAGDERAAFESQNRALEFALVLTVPACVGSIVLAQPIMSLLFERGAFTAADAAASGAALAAFSIGLPAYVLVKVLTPGFFARHDTATPVLVALAAMALNVLFSLAVMWQLRHVGIALATALAAWLNAGLLAVLLQRRGALGLDARVRRRTPRLVLAALAMGAMLVLAERLGHPAARSLHALWLAAEIAGGAALFLGLGQLIGALDLRELLQVLGRRRPAPAA